MTALKLEQCLQILRQDRGAEGYQPDGRGGRVRGLRRPLGLRQVHAAAGDRGARGCHQAAPSKSPETWSTDVPPAKRGIAMVFQTYALYPHLTVHGNMALGLKQAGEPKEVIEDRIAEATRMLHLEPYLKRRPAELSGGQRQRVAIGRAVVRQPKLFLFDEPLSNLDAALRMNTRIEIADLHRKLDTTMIYVTHDQIEAMTLADPHRRAARRDRGTGRRADGPLQRSRQPVRRGFPWLALDELPARRDWWAGQAKRWAFGPNTCASSATGSAGGRDHPCRASGRRHQRSGRAEQRRGDDAAPVRPARLPCRADGSH